MASGAEFSWTRAPESAPGSSRPFSLEVADDLFQTRPFEVRVEAAQQEVRPIDLAHRTRSVGLRPDQTPGILDQLPVQAHPVRR